MMVREATARDWSAIWPFFDEVMSAGETYTYRTDLTEEEGRQLWMTGPPGRTTVAVGADGTVLGSAKMYPNQAGPGSHIASASYLVDAAHRGRGIGRALCEESLAWARAAGFHGMQYNAVAATNAGAVALYESLGFSVIGTVPGGFRHPVRGYTGLHIMFCPF